MPMPMAMLAVAIKLLNHKDQALKNLNINAAIGLCMIPTPVISLLPDMK